MSLPSVEAPDSPPVGAAYRADTFTFIASENMIDKTESKAADTSKNTDAVDSSANVSTTEEVAASKDQGVIGKEVVLNANGMKLEGKITEAVTGGAATGAVKIEVDGTVYDSTGYGWEKSQYHFKGEETPPEYRAMANAR